MARLAREEGDDRQGVEPRRILRTIAEGEIAAAAELIRHAEAIGEEDEIEKPILQHPRDIRVELRISEAACGERVPPDRVAMHHRPRDQETGELDLSRRGHHRHHLTVPALACEF
jgi:hypothetical protein